VIAKPDFSELRSSGLQQTIILIIIIWLFEFIHDYKWTSKLAILYQILILDWIWIH